MFVDVNIGNNETTWIAIYEGDTAERLADEFEKEHFISQDTKRKLIDLLKIQMNSVLEKIIEEEDSFDI